MNPKSDILIIGAGVIGLSCAYELSKRGASVTLIDQRETGLGCSYGNAGWITPCFAHPLPMPGMFFKSIQWLLDPLSPLRIKPEPSILLARWLWRFMRSMNQKSARRSIGALIEISKYSLLEYEKLSQELDSSFGFDRKGLLMVGQTDDGIRGAITELKWASEFGIKGHALKKEEVKALEPAIVGDIQGGVYFPDEAHCEPYAFVKALERATLQKGVRILSSTEVFDFQEEGNQIRSVRTTRGQFEAKQFVLATGAWSQAIVKGLKLNLPILGGKGYSLIFKPFHPAPSHPIMFVERKIAITPRQDSIRIAGTLELVNRDDSISPNRVDAIIRGAQRILNLPPNSEPMELWRGLRPCTPDGVPVIGFSKKHSNLFICAGHQMLGLQSAPGTGRLAADLLMGEVPAFDPSPFSAHRF